MEKPVGEMRDRWADEAKKNQDRRHEGPHTKVRLRGEDQPRYSFLGNGLLALEKEEEGWVRWQGPHETGGLRWWAADDTTMNLSEAYGLDASDIDLLDQMDQEGKPLEELLRKLAGAPSIF